MQRFQTRAVILGLCLTLSIPSALAFDFDTVKENISKFTLDNGLTVIVMEDHSAPVVTCVTYANVGTVDDPKGATGLAHVFEHMAFKGTTEIGVESHDVKAEAAAIAKVDEAFNAWRDEVLLAHLSDPARLEQLKAELKFAQDAAGEFVVTNEFGRIVEKNGGVGLNAGTGSDQTVYFFSLPSNRVELWFAMESSRFIDPVMREFYKEVDVVKEERRMRTESSPVGRLIEEFLGAAFKAHPYGITGVGHMSDLDMTNREVANTFYAKYYVPSNLVVAVVGDVKTRQIKKLAKSYFGRLPKADKPQRVGTVEPPQLGERRVSIEDKAQPFFIVGYHRPAETHADNAAYAALGDYLGQGRTSILYKKLVIEDKIAVQTSTLPQFPGSKYPTLFGVYAVPAQGVSAKEVEDAVLAEIEKLKTDPIPAEELEFIKARARASLINDLSSRSGMAIQLAAYETAYGNWERLFDELDLIQAVTAEDIQRIANDVFVRKNRTVGTIETIEPTEET